MGIEQRLKELDITLPPPATPAGLYKPVTRSGAILFVSGQVPKEQGIALSGKVGVDLSIQEGFHAARIAALNALAAVQQELGSLDRVRSVLFLRGYVNCSSDFTAQPQVLNGASELLIQVFGAPGAHARAAMGVNALPSNVPVEIELTVECAS